MSRPLRSCRNHTNCVYNDEQNGIIQLLQAENIQFTELTFCRTKYNHHLFNYISLPQLWADSNTSYFYCK